MNDQQEQYRKAFAEVIESYGKRLSPQEMVGMFGAVLEEHGIHLKSQLECEQGRDLDDVLIGR